MKDEKCRFIKNQKLHYNIYFFNFIRITLSLFFYFDYEVNDMCYLKNTKETIATNSTCKF